MEIAAQALALIGPRLVGIAGADRRQLTLDRVHDRAPHLPLLDVQGPRVGRYTRRRRIRLCIGVTHVGDRLGLWVGDDLAAQDQDAQAKAERGEDERGGVA